MKVNIASALFARLQAEHTGLNRWGFTAKKVKASTRKAPENKKKNRKMYQLSKRRNRKN